MSEDRKFTRREYESAVLAYEAALARRQVAGDEVSEARRAYDAAVREERAAQAEMLAHLTDGAVAVPRYLTFSRPEPEQEPKF